MKLFSELYNAGALKATLPKTIEEINNLLDYEPQQGEVVWMLDTIGHAGNAQPEAIAKFFELDIDPSDEWVWEAIEEAEWKLTEQAQALINGDLPDYLGIGFGHEPWGGDYGLLLWWIED